MNLLPLLAVGALAVPMATPVAPPTHPGAWHQVGASVTSARAGKAPHFFRIVQYPNALAIVARSSSARPIKVVWYAYCEFSSDDDITEAHEGSLKGVGTVTVYPSVFDGATSCSVSVNAYPASTAKVTAAVFAY
jgi:hypothetical protein